MSTDEQELYSIRSYTQASVGELTDYQIIKQQQERNKELAKLRQTPEFKKRERDGMINLIKLCNFMLKINLKRFYRFYYLRYFMFNKQVIL